MNLTFFELKIINIYIKSFLFLFIKNHHRNKSIKQFNLIEFFLIKYPWIFKLFKDYFKEYNFLFLNTIIKFVLFILIKNNRKNLIVILSYNYLILILKQMSFLIIEILTSIELIDFQKEILLKKLKKLTNIDNILLINIKRSQIIEGFGLRVYLKQIDLTLNNRIFQFNSIVKNNLSSMQ
uniref:ATP synthase CF1 delta subunit n=1 Tax=Nitzschia sp. PL3-2 TaxID=2083271 RepID=A0A2Z5ZAS2_9STRA|nr:ATP synthase CF1 delta subunit [Nitzschia sp. PL3-2]